MNSSITFKNWLLLAVITLISVVLSYVYIDKSVALWFAGHQNVYFNLIGKLVQFVFYPKLWTLVSVVAVVVLWFRKKSTNEFIGSYRNQFFLNVVLAACITVPIKILFARYRPAELIKHQLYGFHFLSTQHQLNSMPSGHTTMIFMALTFFALRYRLKAWFLPLLLLASITAFFRVVSLYHYPSDLMVGAFIGYTSALILYSVCQKITQKNYV